MFKIVFLWNKVIKQATWGRNGIEWFLFKWKCPFLLDLWHIWDISDLFNYLLSSSRHLPEGAERRRPRWGQNLIGLCLGPTFLISDLADSVPLIGWNWLKRMRLRMRLRRGRDEAIKIITISTQNLLPLIAIAHLSFVNSDKVKTNQKRNIDHDTPPLRHLHLTSEIDMPPPPTPAH